MIKRDITETVYEYDKDGHLTRKTVTETHEEDSNITDISYPYTHKSWPYEITCTGSTTATNPQGSIEKAAITG
jgi:hypothetical protein